MAVQLTENRAKSALSVGVANVTLRTHTLGVVADDGAEGVGATGARARITALLVDAGKR